jgi:hypothetical protein
MGVRNRVSDGSSIADEGEIVATQKGQFGIRENGSKVLFPAGREQAKFACPRDGLGAALDAQLAIDAAGVPLDRVQCDDEPLSDLLGRWPCSPDAKAAFVPSTQRTTLSSSPACKLRRACCVANRKLTKE